MSRLDLRSVYADDVDDGAETPRGWLKRTKSLLTPRSSGANRRSPSRRDDGGGWEAVQVTGCHCHCHHCLLHCHLRLTHLHHLPLQVTAVVAAHVKSLVRQRMAASPAHDNSSGCEGWHASVRAACRCPLSVPTTTF